jgi:excisionase family DNA binding protein
VTSVFHTVKEVAGVLRLSPSKVYELLEAGRLRYHRHGEGGRGAIRVSQRQLDAYLAATETVAPEEADYEFKHV